MQNKIISIHQPDFFPWLGLFDKINRSDVLIILDHVINNPRDPLWTKRVQIISNGVPYWLTIPLERPHKEVFQPINKMRISQQFNPQKDLKTIEQNYKKAPYFEEFFSYVEKYYQYPSPFIAERNIHFIFEICDKLDIKANRYISSCYNFKKNSNELLIEIINHFKCSAYIHGKGALEYQKNDMFENQNIKLIYQNFSHPVYPQYNTRIFYPGLSIIDSLMNLGFDGVKKLLTK